MKSGGGCAKGLEESGDGRAGKAADGGEEAESTVHGRRQGSAVLL
ncbi:MAG TPA: hypothetical protein VGO47_10340 [Chlamydiales bacterium]|nr:hypothetical protein [Chlamydiales bacterium]